MIRLYTEDKNRDYLLTLVRQFAHSFTVIPAIGAWNGKLESSLILEFADLTRSRAEELARAISLFNLQDAVLITETQEQFSLISSPVRSVAA